MTPEDQALIEAHVERLVGVELAHRKEIATLQAMVLELRGRLGEAERLRFERIDPSFRSALYGLLDQADKRQWFNFIGRLADIAKEAMKKLRDDLNVPKSAHSPPNSPVAALPCGCIAHPWGGSCPKPDSPPNSPVAALPSSNRQCQWRRLGTDHGFSATFRCILKRDHAGGHELSQGAGGEPIGEWYVPENARAHAEESAASDSPVAASTPLCETTECHHPASAHDWSGDCTFPGCTCATLDLPEPPSVHGPCPTCSPLLVSIVDSRLAEVDGRLRWHDDQLRAIDARMREQVNLRRALDVRVAALETCARESWKRLSPAPFPAIDDVPESLQAYREFMSARPEAERPVHRYLQHEYVNDGKRRCEVCGASKDAECHAAPGAAKP